MLQPKRTKFRKLQKKVVITKKNNLKSAHCTRPSVRFAQLGSLHSPSLNSSEKNEKLLLHRPKGNKHKLAFGTFGIKTLTSGSLCSNTIETLRRALNRKFKRTGKIWIRIFPHLSVTKKPAEVRMGKGKGSPAFWLAKVPAGQIIFEISGVSDDLMKQALQLISGKVSLKLLLIKN